MSLAEGVSARVAYKAYASGAMVANALAVSASDLGASDAQILRRVSTTLSLAKDTYQSAEIRSDRQIVDFRHGVRRAQGSINGEFSPGTYADLFEAAFRGTWAAAVSASQSSFTSVTANNGTSKFTFSAGDPVALGFRVGMVIQFASLSDADNNGKNFLIINMGGTSNRELTVYPAPDTMTADSAFTVTSVGQRLIVPSSSHVSRKFGFEVYNEDLDMARLFTECRVGGCNMQLPATGMAMVDFNVMGRGMEVYEDSGAPFFTSPAAATTTGIFAAVNGLLRVNGSVEGVVTGLNIGMALNPTGPAVVGQNFPPEIFLGRANVTGQVTALLEDADLINNFVDEDEIDILAFLTTTNAEDSPAVSIYLPRVKFGGADVQTEGETEQIVTLPFTALKSTAVESTTGKPETTIQIVDTTLS